MLIRTPFYLALAATLAGGCNSLVQAAEPGYLATETALSAEKLAAKAVERKPFYVRYRKGRAQGIERAIEAQGGDVTHRLQDFDTVAVMMPEPAVEALTRQADVLLVEPVPEHKLLAQVVPWNIDQFQARDIWDKDRDGNVDPGEPDGSGVKFCIIDTGFYYDIDGAGPDTGHDDFVGVTASGVSQITGEQWHFDGNGHGTHVAGTANAMNNTVGVVGVMPGGAELFIVKIFNNSGVWVNGQSNLGAAAQACRDAGANVLSMSLGGGASATEEAIFQSLYDTNNILNIAAAGNDGNTTASYPASYESVVSVAAIDENELAADFTQYPASAYGTPANTTPRANTEWDVVELAGGGVQVLSTVPAPNGAVPVYQASANSIVYSGAHIEEAGLGTVTADLVSGGLCDTTNAGWNGRVVLCQRGSVNFAVKVNNVRNSGGVAALIYNNAPGSFGGTCAGACTQPSIPAISLSQAQGQELLATAINDPTEVIADNGSSCTTCNGGYDYYSGTSMATPGVAAAVGFIWDSCGGPATVTNKQIRQLLRDTAKDLTGTQPVTNFVYGAGWDRVTGWGLVQLRDALELGNTRFGGNCPILLAVAPSQQEMCTASTDSTQFTVTLDDRFLGSATLSASGLPLGSSGSFGTNPVVHPTKSSTYTLSGLTGNSGVHTLQFTAVDGAAPSNTAQGFAVLSTVGSAPTAPSNTSPANGATGVAIQPTLNWTPVADAGSYTLEVATDAGFSNIVYTAQVEGTSHTLGTALAPNTQHHWRVRASNICGGGTNSAASSFTTANLVCQVVNSTNVPLAITDASGNPSNPTPGVTNSTLTSAVTGTLVDVNVVSLSGTHTWINDLSFNLISPAATNVQVMARSCADQDNFNLNLDDEAAAGAWPCPPTGGGTYRPSNPLSAFDGQAANGTWTLRITDSGRQDTGTLQSWGLNLCVIPPVVNQTPTATPQSVATNEDTALPITLTGSDPESQPLTYAIASGPANGALSGTAPNVTYTPNANFNGADSFTFTVNDGTNTSTAATVSITVNPQNDAPVANAQSVSTNEDTALPITLTGSDVDGNPLSYAVGTGPSNGVLSGTVPNLTYTPSANFNGADSFTFTVNDGTVSSPPATVSITVNAQNDTPVANAQSVSTDEDVALVIVLAGSDVENSPLSYAVTTGPTNGALSGTAPNLTYTPNANFNGADSFSFTVNDGSATSAAATVAITVNPVNDAPTANDDAATVAFNSSNNAIGVLANDTFAPDVGETLTITAVTQPANGSVSFTAGSVSFTPNAGFNGVTAFTYTISDGNGGSDTATVTVTVSTNNPPTANNDSITVDEDSGATVVNVLANDSTAPDVGETLTVTAVTQGSLGSVSLVGGVVSYTPNADANGADSFTYTISDGNGGTDTATVSVTINPVDDGPAVANDDVATVDEDSSNNAIDVLANDTADPDDNSLEVIAVGAASNGSTAFTAGGVTYTPNADYCGADSFGYTVNGGDTALVSVTVTCIDDGAAVANDDSATVDEDSSNAINVLANDTADPDDNSLEVIAVGAASNGSTAFTAAGVSYTPNANYCGADSFGYTVNGGDTALVSVSVTCINDAPTTSGIGNQVSDEGDSVSLDVNAAFSDIDSASLSLSTASTLPDGLSFAGGVFSGTLGFASEGSYPITVTASDGTDSVDASFTWTINPLEFTVTAGSVGNGSITPASQTVGYDGTASFTVTPDAGHFVASVVGDTCTVAGAGSSYSAANIQADCAVTATFDVSPPGSFTPGNVVVYRVGDGSGALGSTGTRVFLDEIDSSTGALVQSIPMPTDVDGANARCTANGTATAEGFLSRSTNLGYLVGGCYDQSVGGTVTAGARVAFRVGADSSVDTSTALTDVTSGALRTAASTDGDALWVAGNNFTRYATLGDTTSTALNALNARVAQVFDGQLYVATAAAINAVGAGLPTSGTPVTTPVLSIGGGSIYGFWFADLSPSEPGLDTLYVAQDNANPISKYSKVGGVWTLNNIVGTSSAYRGLTGQVNIDGSVTLFLTRTGAPAGLYTLTDTAGHNANNNGTPTLLHAAASNTALRGVAFAPEPILPATVTLSNLSQTYTGSPLSVGVTTDPAGLTVEVTYDGSTTAPTNAGTYAVVATVTEPGYTGSASGSFVIGKATATVTLGDLAQTFDGAPKPVSVTTAPAGLAVDVTYDGSATAPSAVGSYAVVATVNDSNYEGSANGTLVIESGNTAPTTGGLTDQTGTELEPFAYGAGAGFSDPDADELTFSAAGLPASLTIDPATGGISGTPAFGERGDYTVTVRATDAGGLFVEASFLLTIEAPAPLDGPIFRDGFEALAD